MPTDQSLSESATGSRNVDIRVTVLLPRVDEASSGPAGICELLVESARPLPYSPYRGSVRVGGTEETPTGFHPIRLLKHFEVEPLESSHGASTYRLTIDLSEEWRGTGPHHYPAASRPRRVTEPIDTICKRVAGVFARHCEQFRPPSVSVRLEP
jgi:hypothetical protein